MAAIQALEALKKPCKVELHTDSTYVMKGISEWIHGWKRGGWRTADKSRSRTTTCGGASTQRGAARRDVALGEGSRGP